VLLAGEPGLETDTRKFKFGDGSTAWSALPYSSSDADLSAYATTEYVDTELSNKQDASLDLSAISDIIATSGILVKTGEATWTLDTAEYLTEETDPLFSVSEAASITSTDTSNWDAAYNWGDHASAGYATESYVGTQISNLVDAAPTTLNTLNELAAALGDDANFSTTIATNIGLKAPINNPTFTGTVGGITATMVGLGNVTNESKATMFTSPTFTGGAATFNNTAIKLNNAWQLQWGGSSSTTFINGNDQVGSAQIYFSVGGTQTLSLTDTGATFAGTVSGITKSMVGLGNVTNESKATMFTSPTFTGGAATFNNTAIKLNNAWQLQWGGTSSTTYINGNDQVGSAQMYFSVGGTQTLSLTDTGATFTGTVSGITATMVGLGNVTNESKATMFASPTFTGTTTLQQLTEVVNTKTSATGTVTHDYSTGSIFFHSSISANFTANITNVPTTNNRTIVCTLILSQGATPYVPTAVQIDGSAQTIKWLGTTAPTGNANKVDIVSFTLIRTGSAWTVLGSLSAYG
jgi:hypothetical protein